MVSPVSVPPTPVSLPGPFPGHGTSWPGVNAATYLPVQEPHVRVAAQLADCHVAQDATREAEAYDHPEQRRGRRLRQGAAAEAAVRQPQHQEHLWSQYDICAGLCAGQWHRGNM